MSKVAEIGRLLSHIRLKLIEHCSDNGLTVDDPEYPRKIEELSRMNEMLGLSVRDLKSALHGVTARRQGMWDVPRDKRYGQAVSIADQQREINELLREATETRALSEKLFGRIYSGDEMEGVHTFAELMDKVCGDGSATIHPDQPAYIPATQAHFHASPETAVIMAYVAIRGLVLLGKRGADKTRL
jgi:hypothetical protein